MISCGALWCLLGVCVFDQCHGGGRHCQWWLVWPECFSQMPSWFFSIKKKWTALLVIAPYCGLFEEAFPPYDVAYKSVWLMSVLSNSMFKTNIRDLIYCETIYWSCLVFWRHASKYHFVNLHYETNFTALRAADIFTPTTEKMSSIFYTFWKLVCVVFMGFASCKAKCPNCHNNLWVKIHIGVSRICWKHTK